MYSYFEMSRFEYMGCGWVKKIAVGRSTFGKRNIHFSDVLYHFIMLEDLLNENIPV